DAWCKLPEHYCTATGTHHSADNASSFLEQLLIVPVRVENGQLAGNLVVLSHPQRVHHRQLQLFIGASISSVEAVHVATATGALAATVRVLRLHGQQVFVACMGRDGEREKARISNVTVADNDTR